MTDNANVAYSLQHYAGMCIGAAASCVWEAVAADLRVVPDPA